MIILGCIIAIAFGVVVGIAQLSIEGREFAEIKKKQREHFENKDGRPFCKKTQEFAIDWDWNDCFACRHYGGLSTSQKEAKKLENHNRTLESVRYNHIKRVLKEEKKRKRKEKMEEEYKKLLQGG